MQKPEQYLIDDCDSAVQDYIEELESSNKWHREMHATWDNWFKEEKIRLLTEKGDKQTWTERFTKKLIIFLKSLGRSK